MGRINCSNIYKNSAYKIVPIKSPAINTSLKLGVGNVNNLRVGSKTKKPQRAVEFRLSDLPDSAGSFFRSGSLFKI